MILFAHNCSIRHIKIKKTRISLPVSIQLICEILEERKLTFSPYNIGHRVLTCQCRYNRAFVFVAIVRTAFLILNSWIGNLISTRL